MKITIECEYEPEPGEGSDGPEGIEQALLPLGLYDIDVTVEV